ncbi:MAG: hypothetical protein ACPHCI_04315 [Solirubrobacterales bacterium]
MTDRRETKIEIALGDPAMVADVLERVVSATAALANMQIDRLVNALTVVDALAPSAEIDVSAENPRQVGITVSEGRLELAFEQLIDGEAERFHENASLPAVGNVLNTLASGSAIEADGELTKLVVVLD